MQTSTDGNHVEEKRRWLSSSQPRKTSDKTLLIQHLRFAFLASRHVRKDLPFVYATEFVLPCYGSPRI